jgi:hypothetical protein
MTSSVRKTPLLALLALGMSLLAITPKAQAFGCDPVDKARCDSQWYACYASCDSPGYPCTCYCDNDHNDCLAGAGCIADDNESCD